jgi:hypothetical protein
MADWNADDTDWTDGVRMIYATISVGIGLVQVEVEASPG